MAAPHVTGAVVRYVAAHGTPATAAATVAVLNALVAASQPMADWGTGAVASDPDDFHEGGLYLSRDVAVTALFLTPDAPNQVYVTVANQSGAAQTSFTVYLYANGVLVGTRTVTDLAAGAAPTLTFEYEGLSGDVLTAEVRTAFDLDPDDNISDPLVVG